MEMHVKPIWEEGYTQNRELSWLSFNARILEEADDAQTPLLERLQFLSIFTTNLDEFFMVRVGGLREQAASDSQWRDDQSGMTAREQLSRIYKKTRPLYKRRAKIYSDIMKTLAEQGIRRVSMKRLKKKEEEFAQSYFSSIVLPCLSPYIVQAHYPFPHVENKRMYVGVHLQDAQDQDCFGLIPVPQNLPEIVFLPKSSTRFLATEDVIMQYAGQVFSMYEVQESALFCVTRNADIPIDLSKVKTGDAFRAQMERLLQKRTRADVVRLEVSRPVSKAFSRFLCSKFEIQGHQMFLTRAPIRLQYVSDLQAHTPDALRAALCHAAYIPRAPEMLMNQPLWAAVQQRDVVISYPYESMQPFLQMLRGAAHNPNVTEIGIALYRIATQAKLAEYLCAAAENGKKVTILLELRARFDERNNIDWSERFEEAGCNVIYGPPKYKVHAKLCSIRYKDGTCTRDVTYIGTGNFNEKTAKQYTDVALVTSDAEIGQDGNTFFDNMVRGIHDGYYQTLLVAPKDFRPQLLMHIAREAGKEMQGFIRIKCNSLTDVEVMRALSAASCAGATVQLIVRGICCLLPGVSEKTEHIEVHGIVGRFLEHSRIFCFGRGEDEIMYLSSADLMTRNTERRVEVACPVRRSAARARLHELLDIAWADTEKARRLTRKGDYERITVKEDAPRVCAQELLMRSDMHDN